MELLKKRLDELKHELTGIFDSAASHVLELRELEGDNRSRLEKFVSDLEQLNRKVDTRNYLVEFFVALDSFTEDCEKDRLAACKEIATLKETIMDEYERVETNLILPSLYGSVEGLSKLSMIVREITFLTQYDDIITQGFLSCDAVLEVFAEIERQDRLVCSEDLLKLKVLLSSLVVSLFDMFEDTLSLLESKFFRVASILSHSFSYMSTAIGIINEGRSPIYVHAAKMKKISHQIEQPERFEILFALSEWKFLEDYSEINKLKGASVGKSSLTIGNLFTRTFFSDIMKLIDDLFLSAGGKARDDAESVDFGSYFMDMFRIKEHKQILSDIFEMNVKESFDENIEFF